MEPTQEVTDKDFVIFYQQEDPEDLPGPSHRPLLPAQISTSQEAANTLEGVLEEKTLDLLALLTTHMGAAILVVPRLPTPAPTHASFGDAANKKRKGSQRGKGSEGAEEGEITCPSQQPPTKEPRATRAQ